MKDGKWQEGKIWISKIILDFCLYFSFGPYFVEPIIAGLDPKTNEPFLSVMDLIGQPCISSDFAVIGCASEQLYGMCEALWQPNMVSLVTLYLKKNCFKILLNKRKPKIYLKQYLKR